MQGGSDRLRGQNERGLAFLPAVCYAMPVPNEANERNCIELRNHRIQRTALCLVLAALLLIGCAPVPEQSDVIVIVPATETPAPVTEKIELIVTEPEPIHAETGPITQKPQEPESTPEVSVSHYTFRPKVVSCYFREVFGDAMCETWFNLVDAVLAGETSFACPDDHTYNWVMGQFPIKCLPALYEQIAPDPTADPDHPVQNGVGHFQYVTSAEEVNARIDAFAGQIEGILNKVLEDDYSDFEKAFALYRYCCETYEYDYEAADMMYEVYVDYLCSYRVFETGTGICCEIAPAYAYLLMQAGVEATNMGGKDHDWTYVKINGNNYHIDATFGLGTDGALAYFLMDDDQRAEEGYPKKEHEILCNYSSDHPHPDYTADDDTFRPLWKGFDAELDHAAHTLHYRYYDDDGALREASFDYGGY